MQLIVSKGSGQAVLTAPVGLVRFDGNMPDNDKTEIRTLLEDRGTADSKHAYMIVRYGKNSRSEEVNADQQSFSDLWLAIVALNELPAKGYTVGVRMDAEEAVR